MSEAPISTLEAARARSAQVEEQIAKDPSQFRVLTGERPTGSLHIGHYFGTIANRVRLQTAGVETILILADYQVITDRDVMGDLRGTVREIMLDYLASGIDPEKTTIFTHSAVPALNQLMLPFLSLVSVSELERNPTVKAETAATGGRAMSGLMLTYPVHQAADILFCHGNLVPVGQDQLPHLEMTRTIARRFNQRYAGGEQYFREPEALLAPTPTILGTDGTKTLPTGGTARFSSPLSADDFVKKSQFTYYTAAALAAAAPKVAYFAAREGLDGHAVSAMIRSEEKKK